MGTAPREPRSLSSGTRWLDTRPSEHMDGRGRMWAPWRPRTRLHREAAAETAHPPPAPWLSLPGRVGQEQKLPFCRQGRFSCLPALQTCPSGGVHQPGPWLRGLPPPPAFPPGLREPPRGAQPQMRPRSWAVPRSLAWLTLLGPPLRSRLGPPRRRDVAPPPLLLVRGSGCCGGPAQPVWP